MTRGSNVRQRMMPPYRFMHPNEFEEDEDEEPHEDTIWSILCAISERITANGFINLYKSKGMPTRSRL